MSTVVDSSEVEGGREDKMSQDTSIEIIPTLEYLKELEEQLYEFELSNVEMTLEMHNLYKLIEQLMDMTFESRDDNMKVQLAVLEKKARECSDCIKSRLAIQN